MNKDLYLISCVKYYDLVRKKKKKNLLEKSVVQILCVVHYVYMHA